MGIISSIIPSQDPMSKLHTSKVLENFLNNFKMNEKKDEWYELNYFNVSSFHSFSCFGLEE